ncbi:rRNA maturation RNase YbeY [Halomonas sp.]|uniref:rRNA maturation RNase YbeY n=1 Tax=Halomonas sp. TaxID=1486246 RepID=UPI0035685077
MRPLLVDRQLAIEADGLPGQSDLEAWVSQVLNRHPDEHRHELTIRFVDETESRTLNRDYRGKERPTNVLSFPFEGPPGIELPLLGDLVICHPVVIKEALEQDKSPLAHYAHMVIHGTLHLLGHDHIETLDAEDMEALEGEILAVLGIPGPYDADSPAGNEAGRPDHEDERPDA